MKRSERGFTLVEILVVLAIVALIGSAATMTTFQMLTATKRSNDHMTAIRQVQNAGYWISHDVQMAQSITTDDDPETAEIVESITLKWTDWDGNIHRIAYTLEDGELKRSQEGNGEPSQILVAQFIDSAIFSEEDGTWKLYIEATSGTVTETREYKIDPRVNM